MRMSVQWLATAHGSRLEWSWRGGGQTGSCTVQPPAGRLAGGVRRLHFIKKRYMLENISC